MQEALSLEYDATGQLIKYIEPGRELTFEYSLNYLRPNTNVDLNGLMLTGLDCTPLNVILLGLCGDLGSALIEQELYGKKSSESISFDDWTPGRHHRQYTYEQQSEETSFIVEDDSKGYPSKRILRRDIEEWLCEFDYVVDEKGGCQIDEDTVKRSKTGTILGHMDDVHIIEYMD